MRKKIYLILSFFTITHLCFSQAIHLSKDTLPYTFRYLYILEFYNKPTVVTKNAFVDMTKVDTVYSLPDSESITICHLLNVTAVFVMRLKHDAKSLTLNEIFSFYNIAPRNRKLLIKINDQPIDFPETILVSEGVIDRVKISKGYSGSYINIILKGYLEAKKAFKKGGVFVQ
jgi:hypothetical protein